MSFSRCPIDDSVLDGRMRCRQCGREWESRILGGEATLISRPRRVQLVRPLVPGARHDDCIKPFEDIGEKPCDVE